MKALLDILKINDFFDAYPEMSIRPKSPERISFHGLFRFTAQYGKYEEITDHYWLKIEIHKQYPKRLPKVFEPKHKIKPEADFHINRDNSFCLGSRVHLWWKLSKDSSLSGFADTCLVPYLYAQSFFAKHSYYPFDELDHGPTGELDDVADLLGLDTRDQALYALKLLSMKKNRANKKNCPCGCNNLTGRCDFNHRLKKFRGIVNRKRLRELYKQHTSLRQTKS